MTEGWGGWFGDDDDQPEEPAPARTAQQERADVVAWLRTQRNLVLDEIIKLDNGLPENSKAILAQLATIRDAENLIATGQHEGASDEAPARLTAPAA